MDTPPTVNDTNHQHTHGYVPTDVDHVPPPPAEPEMHMVADENAMEAGDTRENDPPTPAVQVDNITEATDTITEKDEEEEVKVEEEVPDTRYFPALSLREVLMEIMAHSDNASVSVAARVSSQWSEAALDTLYRRSPELYDLVSILAPIAETSFSREPYPSNWQRFMYYAKRVHTLAHDTTGSMSRRHLSETVFQELSLSRMSLQILPNLRTLVWTASRPRFLRASLLFIYDTVTSLTLRITRADGAKSFESYLCAIADRVPNLTYFELDIPRGISECEEQLVAMLGQLKKLTTIVLPHFFLSTPVVSVLASLPLLEVVTLRKGDHIGDSKDLAALRLPSSRDAFPSIRKLSLDTNLHELHQFLLSKRPQSFSKLEYLHISSLTLESPGDIHNLLLILPEACPNLVGLMLALLSLSVATPSHSTDITVDTLRPLFTFASLKDFGLTYNYPLRLTHDDCEILARGLSNLRSLYLCESSYDTHDRSATSLTLFSLLPFAKYCPNLEELGLFIDTAPSVMINDDAEPSTPSEPLSLPDLSQVPLPNVADSFKRLHTLSVGQSFLPATHVVSTSLFLSMLLPPGCQFQTGCTDRPHCFSPTYHEASPHPESDDAFQTRLNQWAEVKKLVPTLQSIRAADQQRAQDAEREKTRLREEVEELRRQLASFKASGRVGNLNGIMMV